MERFRDDNTEGYDARDLAALNDAWVRIMVVLEVDDETVEGKSVCDAYSEALLYAYDQGRRGDDLLIQPSDVWQSHVLPGR